MLWLVQEPDSALAPDPEDRTVGDVAAGEKTTETKEDVFKRQHDEAVRGALEEQQRRGQFRERMESEVERIRPRKERYEALQAERKARREQARQASLERAQSARTDSQLREAERRAKREERAQQLKERDTQAVSKSGQDKPYAQKHRAVYLIEQVRSEVKQRYSEMEHEVDGLDKRLDQIEKELRTLSEEARGERHDFGGESRELKRQLQRRGERDTAISREVQKLRDELFKKDAALRQASNKLRTERATLTAQLNRKGADLKRFKRLVEQIERVYTNRNSTRTDPFKELEALHRELERYSIRLPRLKMPG